MPHKYQRHPAGLLLLPLDGPGEGEAGKQLFSEVGAHFFNF